MQNKKLNLVIVTIFFVVIISCNDNNLSKISSTTLIDTISTVQSYNPDFFYRISDVYVKSNELAFIDMGNNRVVFMKYMNRTEAKPLVFGNKGRGPGEFLAPKSIIFNNNNIFVSDLASQTISIFDKKGNYQKRISAKVKLNFAVNSTGSIFVPNIDEVYLIREYDQEGNILSSFGEKFVFENENIKLNHNFANILIDSNDNFYLVFFDFPIIRKYDKNRKLIWEKNLTYLAEIDHTYKENLVKIKNTPYTLYGLLKDVSIDESYLYIHSVSKKTSSQDIIKIKLDDGEFSGYIDVLDGSITIDKLIVNNDVVFGVDSKGKILIYNIL